MKAKAFFITILVILLAGLAVLTQFQLRHENKNNMGELDNTGRYLVSLISMFPLKALAGEKGDFFIRTLTQYTSKQGLAYCFIHDRKGAPVIFFAREGLSAQIPNQVLLKSLKSVGLTRQTFKTSNSGQVMYEFSKSIYEGGKRTGTVRLGLSLPPVVLFSLERISLLAAITFFMFTMAFFSYYGIMRAFRPLVALSQKLSRVAGTDQAEAGPEPGGSGLDGVIGGIERSMVQIRGRLDKIESDNTDLLSQVGVMAFEKTQFERILDSVNFGIIITDIHDTIYHMNRYWQRTLKMERNDVLDRPLSEVMENRDIINFVSEHGAGEQVGLTSHKEITLEDLAPGSTFRFSLSSMKDAEGASIGKTILIHDITSEKMAERTKQEFIAHVAHELKAPLTTIKSYNEMLMEGEIEGPEMQKEFFNTINDETNRLTGLINNLLNLSKIEMGSLVLDRGLVQTDWLYNDCIAAVEAPAYDKSIVLERILPDNFPSVIGDKEMLKVAIINILGNAVKYTADGGEIKFSLIDQSDTVVFEVTDTGYGISPIDLPHIFDRFYRSSDKNVADEVGSGLGLAITSEIIHLHGGEIEAQSELGVGTRFTITLPREEYQIGRE